jgi:hypothetical protein
LCSWSFDLDHQLTGISDENGSEHAFEVDAVVRLAALRQHLGELYTLRIRVDKEQVDAGFAAIGLYLGTFRAMKDDPAEVDAAAEVGRSSGCLHWEPERHPPPVGYLCALTDPDGNVVEFSYGQGL